MKKISESKHPEFRSRWKNFPVKSDKDLVEIRAYGRKLAREIGFSTNDQTLIATALSEVCRNIIEYAGTGKVIIETIQDSSPGITITAHDQGPGIEDVEKALEEGYSTGKGMGIGLPGCKRIMDQFQIDSKTGKGTVVSMHKWVEENEY